MNNEPVAWRTHYPSGWEYKDGNPPFELKGNSQPLYTHPAKPAICVGYWDNKTGAFHKNLTEIQQKRLDDGFLQAVYTEGMLPAKTLTDEEIKALWKPLPDTKTYDSDILKFARAILRKAQEK